MQFKSEEQRKAVFARIKGKGGGGGRGPKPPKPPKPPGTGGDQMPPLFDIINFGQGSDFQQLPSGPGIPGTQPGTSWIGTGGAIYNNPGSNWFTNEASPNYGTLPDVGTPQYQQPTFAQFQPAQTLWGALYLIVNGVDPDTGRIIPPKGTPGTLRFTTHSPGYDLNHERQAAGHASSYLSSFYGGVGHPSSAYWGQAPKALNKRPWWAK